MRKFILYFLLVLFLAAAGTLVFGFLNAKKDRDWARNLEQTRAKNDLDAQVAEIATGFRNSGGKNSDELRSELEEFQKKLDSIISESQAARSGLNSMAVPHLAKQAAALSKDYYLKVARQAQDIKSILGFVGQIAQTAAIFGEINENDSLEQIREVISKAKEKSDSTDLGSLPPDLGDEAGALKGSMEDFLAKLENTAANSSTDPTRLDEAYSEFAKKQDEFFSAAKQYIGTMENLAPQKQKIEIEISRLENVYFSVR